MGFAGRDSWKSYSKSSKSVYSLQALGEKQSGEADTVCVELGSVSSGKGQAMNGRLVNAMPSAVVQ